MEKSGLASFADIPSIDLQPHKATGPDKIPTCLLKEMAFAITPVLTLLFLGQVFLPDDWRILKKNDCSNPYNY